MCYWPVSRVVLEDPPKNKKEEKKKPDYIMVSDQFKLQPIVSPQQHFFRFVHQMVSPVSTSFYSRYTQIFKSQTLPRRHSMDFNMNMNMGYNYAAPPPKAPPAPPPQLPPSTQPTPASFKGSHHYVYKPVHHEPAQPNPWTNPQPYNMNFNMSHQYHYDGAKPQYSQPAASNNPWTNPQPHYHQPAASNNPWTNPQPHYKPDVAYPSKHSSAFPLKLVRARSAFDQVANMTFIGCSIPNVLPWPFIYQLLLFQANCRAFQCQLLPRRDPCSGRLPEHVTRSGSWCLRTISDGPSECQPPQRILVPRARRDIHSAYHEHHHAEPSAWRLAALGERVSVLHSY